MACQPGQIRMYRWVIQGFGRMEREEAAARIVHFCQQAEQWCGVSWNNLLKMTLADFEAVQAAEKTNERADTAEDLNRTVKFYYQRTMRRFIALSVLSLGLWALGCWLGGKIPKKPQLVTVPKRLDHVTPMAATMVSGPNALVEGVHEMIEMGMLEQHDIGGDDGDSIFFPTPKFAETIALKQGIARAA
jgi:hypothetical protein